MIYIDHFNQTVRPAAPDGDTYFGLVSGTNGTAAAMRRECAPAGYRWIRHCGGHALGITLVPTATSYTAPSPWDGQ